MKVTALRKLLNCTIDDLRIKEIRTKFAESVRNLVRKSLKTQCFRTLLWSWREHPHIFQCIPLNTSALIFRHLHNC